MNTSNSIRYFWLGLTVGAVAAALFTPKSGAATRHYCHTKSHETFDRLRRQAEELRGRAVETIKLRRKRLQTELKRLSAAVDAGKKAFERVA